jgi:hypothetical protein
MADKAPLPPQSPELEFLRRHFKEVPSRPGYFRGWSSPDQLRPFEGIASGAVIFSLNDPYQRNLPFHLSAAFMALPPEARWEFLWRNPMVPLLVQTAGDGMHRLMSLCSGSPIAVADGEVTIGFHAMMKLEDWFGIRCQWHDGDGRLLDPPRFTLRYSWLADPEYGGRTVRERREFRSSMSRRLKGLKWPAQRASAAARYSDLLAIWDAREGWTAPLCYETLGYVPERALSLQVAVQRTSATPDDYYRAFKLISGHEYSSAAWLLSVGWLWLERQDFGHYKRRNSGWRAGTGRAVETQNRAVARFFKMLQNGLDIEIAVTQAGLTPQMAAVLTAPEHRERLIVFAADPGAVEDLLSHF